MNRATFTDYGSKVHLLQNHKYKLLAILSAVSLISLALFSGATGRARLLVNPRDPSTYVYNSTLGFGATILISLKDRTDRRDAVSLICSLSDISITHIIDGVRGEDISNKSKPDGTAKQDLRPAEMGAWRSHMDTFKWIVDNKIETALVFEDDVDWDLPVKSQFHAFASALRTSRLRHPLTPDELLRAPYGLDWDVMHLAPSLAKSHPGPLGDTLATVYRDPDRGPTDICELPPWYCYDEVLNRTNTPSDSRAIIPSFESVGLGAIAVSYRGAQRLLYHLSFKGLDDGVDWGIQKLLASGQLRGWTVVPPLIGNWKVGGPADSDLIEIWDLQEARNTNGRSPNLSQSARQALVREFERPDDGFWTEDKWRAMGIAVS